MSKGKKKAVQSPEAPANRAGGLRASLDGQYIGKLAGILLGILPELLRATDNLRIIIYCLVVLITINFRPQGMLGTYEFSIKRLVARLRRPSSAGGKGGNAA